MSACNFECLLQFVDRQLDLDKQLEVYDHLDRCDICREAVYQIARDLDGVFFIYGAYSVKPYAMRSHIDGARSRRTQMSANAPVRPAVRGSSTVIRGFVSPARSTHRASWSHKLAHS